MNANLAICMHSMQEENRTMVTQYFDSRIATQTSDHFKMKLQYQVSEVKFKKCKKDYLQSPVY